MSPSFKDLERLHARGSDVKGIVIELIVTIPANDHVSS